MPAWNNILIAPHKLIFFLVPKAANSSIKEALKVALKMPKLRHPQHLHRGWKMVSPAEAAGKRDVTMIAVVRNPWSRLVSCYHDKIVGDGHSGLKRWGFSRCMSFGQFIEKAASLPDEDAEIHIRSQVYGMSHRSVFLPQFVYRSEELSHRWDEIRDLVPFEMPHLKRLNRSDHRDYRDYYDRRLYQLVADRWKEDIETFGYSY